MKVIWDLCTEIKYNRRKENINQNRDRNYSPKVQNTRKTAFIHSSPLLISPRLSRFFLHILSLFHCSFRNDGCGQHAAQPLLHLLPLAGHRGSARTAPEETHQHRDQRPSGPGAQLQHGTLPLTIQSRKKIDWKKFYFCCLFPRVSKRHRLFLIIC